MQESISKIVYFEHSSHEGHPWMYLQSSRWSSNEKENKWVDIHFKWRAVSVCDAHFGTFTSVTMPISVLPTPTPLSLSLPFPCVGSECYLWGPLAVPEGVCDSLNRVCLSLSPQCHFVWCLTFIPALLLARSSTVCALFIVSEKWA